MSKNLVIVESPAKAKTIGKYLGNDYMVEASIGHIMDLPKNDIGVELKRRTFQPKLIVSPGKEKLVDRLKKLASKADAVYLAPDPDREGEAIAAHLQMQLQPAIKGKTTIQRVTFNEITKPAVVDAFKRARNVNENLMLAQQTRRVLDRLVGYEISPLLWDKVRRGLSAGRVQTVALRLIVDRENEIKAFQPVEYWPLTVRLRREAGSPEVTAKLREVNGKLLEVDTVSAPAFADEASALTAQSDLQKASYHVLSVEEKEYRRTPPAPFSTSQLQQQASSQLGFNVKRTMGVAQRLYEGVEVGSDGTVGLITYMRTDSTRVSPQAIEQARHLIESYGQQYLPEKPRAFKGKADAQDAHEAVRPTNVNYSPESIRRYLTDEQFRLYDLIWRRFVASQMTAAIFDRTTVGIEANGQSRYGLRVTGSVLKFDGFLRVADPNFGKPKPKTAEQLANAGGEEEEPEGSLPKFVEGESLVLGRVIKAPDAPSVPPVFTEQKFTQPPPRFNEASLVKELEERGIGRPSTYASIINTIQDRDYVKKLARKFVPTEIGMVVTTLLVKNFPYIFDMAYTRKLEEELDEVEGGKIVWTSLLGGFYDHLTDEIKVAEKSMEEIKRWEKPSGEPCEKCGSPLILRWGKFGSFYSCSNYTKAKPRTIAVSAWKKDPKAALKRVKKGLNFPFKVQGLDAGVIESDVEVHDDKELKKALDLAASKGKSIRIEPQSCDFTRENVADKPDLAAMEAGDTEEEEFCENCGKQMVLKNGPFGPYMSCPDYNADPPCKTVRRLNQKVQSKPPEPTGEPCPECGMELVKRTGTYGEFTSCSGYPKCKYVKQVLLDVPCPKCHTGKLAERKAKTGNVFYGCTNYPKCDYSSNLKLIAKPCPRGNSTYLLEVPNKEDGTVHEVCPHNHDALPKRRPKKGAAPVQETADVVTCDYDASTGRPNPVREPVAVPVLERPDPEKTRPVIAAVA